VLYHQLVIKREIPHFATLVRNDGNTRSFFYPPPLSFRAQARNPSL